MKEKMTPLLRVLLCCVLSFLLDFWLIPTFLARGVPDLIWMALMAILPAILAGVMLKNVRPGLIFLGLLVHYGLLILLAVPLSDLWGSSVKSTLGWFSYIGSTFLWPIVITILQFAVLHIMKKD